MGRLHDRGKDPGERRDVLHQAVPLRSGRRAGHVAERARRFRDGVGGQDRASARQKVGGKPVDPGLKVGQRSPAPDRGGAAGLEEGRKILRLVGDRDADGRPGQGYGLHAHAGFPVIEPTADDPVSAGAAGAFSVRKPRRAPCIGVTGVDLSSMIGHQKRRAIFMQLSQLQVSRNRNCYLSPLFSGAAV